MSSLLQRERPPAYAASSHDPKSLELPAVPSAEPLSPAPSTTSKPTLPDLHSLNLPKAGEHGLSVASNATVAPSHNGHPQYLAAAPAAISHAALPSPTSTAPRSTTEDVGSPAYAESVMSLDEHTVRSASASRDDPDVLIAAEALSGLGNPDYIRSPTSQAVSLPRTSLSVSSKQDNGEEAEPLLSLLTSSHPWLGGTINGSLSAYSSTKHYSPRFIQYGADFVERNIGTPVASTVGSVGRRTGVEGSLRRFLRERRPSDAEREAEAPSKRRRLVDTDAQIGADRDAMDVDVERALPTPTVRSTHQSRRQSQASSYAESLPAYDDNMSPQYEEQPGKVLVFRDGHGNPQQHVSRSWSTQLMITTSGLGVALSENSLNSLKACLGILRSATAHISKLMRALSMVLEEYERAMRPHRLGDNETGLGAESAATEKMRLEEYLKNTEQADPAREIAARIKALSDDIWNTLKTVVSAVSRYTGGALPENAGLLVRRQLMSVPQRWRIASASTAVEQPRHDSAISTTDATPNAAGKGNISGDAKADPNNQAKASTSSTGPARSAQRMLAFAREGLDMIAQVSAVVDSTVGSAEEWLGSLGRKNREEARQLEKGEESPEARHQRLDVQHPPQAQDNDPMQSVEEKS